LLSIKGRPLLENILEKVSKIDIDEIIIITNAKFYDNFQKWVDKSNYKIKITLINDGTTSNENRLGTLADINLALDMIDDDFMLIYGDNFSNFDLLRPYDLYKSKDSSVMILFDVGLEKAKRLGVITLDENKKIIAFDEKPEHPKSSLCCAGIFIFKKDVKDDMKLILAKDKTYGAMLNFLLYWIENKPVFGSAFDNKNYYFIDVGVPEALEMANNM